jgi:hypothetical protein
MGALGVGLLWRSSGGKIVLLAVRPCCDACLNMNVIFVWPLANVLVFASSSFDHTPVVFVNIPNRGLYIVYACIGATASSRKRLPLPHLQPRILGQSGGMPENTSKQKDKNNNTNASQDLFGALRQVSSSSRYLLHSTRMPHRSHECMENCLGKP